MTGKVLTRPGETRTTFDSGDAYIERIEAAVAIFKSKNLDPERPVPEQMNETVQRGTGRVRNPVYHYVISWQKKSVTHHEAHKAVARTIEALGARGWQWVGALHGDTDNPHCHVIINRIHPETGLAWRSSHDHYKLAKICREIEPQQMRREIVELPSPRAADYEVYTGQLSMQSWARQTVMPTVAERVLASRNRNWDALHQALATHGISYEANGTLTERTGHAPTTTKASGVSTTISLPYLEKRMGQYQAKNRNIELAVEGYGSARERYELTTPRMQKPDLAPFYTTWICARNDWKNGGRERATNERQDARRQAVREENTVRSDLNAAAVILSTSVPELAYDLLNRLNKIAQERIAKIKKKLKTTLQNITKSKPHELFRTWLKNLAKSGDTEAARATTALRQGENMQYSSKTVDGRAGMPPEIYQAYVERVALSAQHYVEMLENLDSDGKGTALYTRMNLAWTELGPDGTMGEPTLERLLKIVDAARAKITTAMTDAEISEKDLVERDIIDAMDATTRSSESTPFLVGIAAVIPFGIIAESDKARGHKLDGRAPRAAWAIMRDQYPDNDVDFGHATHNSMAACRHASPIFRHAIALGLTPDAEMPENYIPLHLEGTEHETPGPRPRTDSISEQEAEDLGIDNGEIRGPRSQPKTDPEEKAYRNRYELFLENFAAVGFGAKAQEAQNTMTAERYRAIDMARSAMVADIPKKNWMERAEVDAHIAKEKANVARTTRMESDVIRLVTGATPPPSFHEYLMSLGEDRAKHLAGRIQHQADVDAARYHSISAEAALHVTVSRTKNGIIYSISGKEKFRDDGEVIRIDSTRDKRACDAALLIAAERFGDNLELDGNAHYKMTMLAHAVELGINIGNPELQPAQEQLKTELAARRAKEVRKFPSDLADRYANTVRNPNMPAEDRREHREKIMMEAAMRTFEREYNIKTTVTQHDESGKIEDLMIFKEHAYALLRNHNDDYVVVPLNAGYAREIAHLQKVKSDVAVTAPSQSTGLSELQPLPTEAEIAEQQQRAEIEIEEEREMAMAGQRTRGGR